ncbi:hypothetical protein ACFQVC_32925 [Streptomyces monticola]|uniref:Excreted virulence factor EspC, type VII ESX diderm n=1 Tax=Streptomyces monticola TaxID=2666263 RepID=A0ABW2JS29_9ACTN
MADLRTITDALRTDARMWDRQSEALGNVHRNVEYLRLSRVQAGIFQLLVDEYEEALTAVSDRCAEGRDRTEEIATALIKNATAYDNREADTARSIEGTY